uniref:NTF2 fold domain-containing protein n=1 Tax=Prevotella sp. GTC17254 TaxID=3236794 RepID=A0AB33ITP4_9BACT
MNSKELNAQYEKSNNQENEMKSQSKYEVIILVIFIAGVLTGITGYLLHTKIVKRAVSPVVDFIEKEEITTGKTGLFDNPDSLGYYLDSGFVPNAKVAYQVAMNILYPIYGYSRIVKEKQLMDKQVWIITGFKDSLSKGGVVELYLRRKDGKVILVA